MPDNPDNPLGRWTQGTRPCSNAYTQACSQWRAVQPHDEPPVEEWDFLGSPSPHVLGEMVLGHVVGPFPDGSWCAVVPGMYVAPSRYCNCPTMEAAKAFVELVSDNQS